MICSHPDCPLERLAKAMEDYKRAHAKEHWAFKSYACHTCSLCKRNRAWETTYPEGLTREIGQEDAA